MSEKTRFRINIWYICIRCWPSQFTMARDPNSPGKKSDPYIPIYIKSSISCSLQLSPIFYTVDDKRRSCLSKLNSNEERMTKSDEKAPLDSPPKLSLHHSCFLFDWVVSSCNLNVSWDPTSEAGWAWSRNPGTVIFRWTKYKTLAIDQVFCSMNFTLGHK